MGVGTNGECGGSEADIAATGRQGETAFYLWATECGASAVDGDTGGYDGALMRLPGALVLPRAVRLAVHTGGGVAFAKTADTGKFRQRMPKRMRRLANRNALLAKMVDSEVKCVDSLDMGEPKTSDLKGMLDAIGIDRTCLLALATENRNTALSARNLERVDTIRIDQLNAFELLNHRFLVIDKASLQSFLDGSGWPNSGDDKEAA